MEIRDVTSLKNWEKNPRNIGNEAYERLKDQLKMGQHSTLLIMPDGTVLGGNMRLRAMKELGIEKAKCLIVDFVKEAEDEGFIAVVDGEPQRSNFFKTKEDGMMAYSLSHNDAAGYYDRDMFTNLVQNSEIDWSKFSVNFNEIPTIAALLKEVETQEKEIDENLETGHECPKCGYKW